jgi:NAD(P)-dependent dehydrogenase (short-subunit alcohol dehydrogenase family)
VINLSQSIALQLAPFNINVNTICPGLIWTPMWAEGMERMLDRMAVNRPELKGLSPEAAFKAMVKTNTPLQRAQIPEDIGNLVAFLASEQAREITGQAINLDGGAQLN